MAVSLSRPEKGRFYARKLTDYELGLYATPDYLQAHGLPKLRADLREHRIIGYIQDLIFMKELYYIPQLSRDLEPWITSSNLIAQMSMVLGNAGLCVLPRFMAIYEPRLTQVLNEEVRLVRSFWLVVHSELRDLARIRTCSDFLTSEVRLSQDQFISR